MSKSCSTLGAGGRSSVLTSRRTSIETVPANLPNAPTWLIATRAAESRKAVDIRVLDLREVTSFADYFLICSATNPRQAQAICDEIGKQLKEVGEFASSVEGYSSAEWILLDYGDFVVHIFSESARTFYDLERLWRHARLVDLPA